VEAKQLLPQPEAMRVTERESGVVHDHADVADVVVEPLELEEDHAQRETPPWYLRSGQPSQGLAIGQRMSHGLVPRHALGERRRPLECQGLEQLLGPLVHEAQSRLEIDDRFALDGETKVAGFDDPGVDRTDGDLEEAVAFDAAEGKRLSRVGEVPTDRHVAAGGEITSGPEPAAAPAPPLPLAHPPQAPT